MLSKLESNLQARSILFIFCCLIFIIIIFRNTGLYPSVFADEYTYSKFSRLLPLNEATIPNYLYFKLYALTNYCGDEFLGCAKILNALFFVAASLFIFKIGQSVSNNLISIFVSLLSILGPISSYTAYFMPESLYFFCFWLFSWQLLRIKVDATYSTFTCVGVLYGLTALIKPHAVLLSPAIFFYISYIFYKNEKDYAIACIFKIAIFFISALTSKLAIGYFLAGQSGITIFGSSYGNIVLSNTSSYLTLFFSALKSLKGHILTICMLYGVPIAIAIEIVINDFYKKLPYESLNNTSVYSLLVIFNLMFLVAVFTALAVNTGPYESLYRLHMRYYNFALPFFYIIAGGVISKTSRDKQSLLRSVVVLVIIGLTGYSLYTHMHPYIFSHVDNPELKGIHANKSIFFIYGSISLLALVFLFLNKYLGTKIYFYFILPFFVIVSTYYVVMSQKSRLTPDVYDQAGIFTKNFLSKENRNVLIVGSDLAGLFRTLYYLDNSDATLEAIPKEASYDIKKLPTDKNWILFIGDLAVPKNTFYKISMNGFSLVRINTSNSIDFKKNDWAGIVSKIYGLSNVEPWGIWSSGNVVRFQFTKPLPQKFDIRLVAHAFGPNIGKEFVAKVGASEARFTFSSNGDQDIILSFVNPRRSKVLDIKVPEPMSPKTLGLSNDERNLGIGFVRLEIS